MYKPLKMQEFGYVIALPDHAGFVAAWARLLEAAWEAEQERLRLRVAMQQPNVPEKSKYPTY